MRVRWGLHLALLGLLALATAGPAQADGWTRADTLQALEGKPYMVACIVRLESSYEPYAVGQQHELGVAQLHPQGLLPTFYEWGFQDPFNPYESVEFLTEYGAIYGYGPWTAARYC